MDLEAAGEEEEEEEGEVEEEEKLCQWQKLREE